MTLTLRARDDCRSLPSSAVGILLVFLMLGGCAVKRSSAPEPLASSDSGTDWLMGSPPVGVEIELPADSPYRQQVFDWLQQNGRYPRPAASRKLEGVVLLEFYIDRSGKLLTYRLAKRSGHFVLDYEVKRMIQMSDPMPPPPVERQGEFLRLTVTLEFEIKPEVGGGPSPTLLNLPMVPILIN